MGAIILEWVLEMFYKKHIFKKLLTEGKNLIQDNTVTPPVKLNELNFFQEKAHKLIDGNTAVYKWVS